MSQPISDAALDQIFREAQTNQYFLDKPVSDEQVHAIWDLMKMAPTSMNMLPARIVWCKSQEAKNRLATHAASGNVEKVQNAPVCAIIGMDMQFQEHLPELFPHADVRGMFDSNDEFREVSAFRNSSMQGGYFILAARALGLDCGPMSGFNNAAVDADFFADTPSFKSNFICSVGYGNPEKVHARLPRPEFGKFNQLL